MAKTYVSFSFCFYIISLACAQNLIPNPGFENFISCPKELGKKHPVFENWFHPTSNPVDYFNRCSKNLGVTENIMGSQEPKSGDAYIGLTLYHQDYRSYAQVELTQSLVAGMKYTVEFSICLSEKSKYAIGNIGAYFTTQKLITKGAGVIEEYENIESNGTVKLLPGLCRPQIKNSPSNFVDDAENWTTIVSSFKARGGEKFMTLGHFFTTPGTPVVSTTGKKEHAYYFIDDVAVYQSGTKPESFTRIVSFQEEPKHRNEPVNKESSNENIKPAVQEETVSTGESLTTAGNKQSVSTEIKKQTEPVNT